MAQTTEATRTLTPGALEVALADAGEDVHGPAGDRLAAQVRAWFGDRDLRAGGDPQIDELAVAWALDVPDAGEGDTVRVLADDNSFVLPLTRLGASSLFAGVANLPSGTAFRWNFEVSRGGRRTLLPDVLAEQAPRGVRESVSWSAIAGPSIAGEVAARRDTCVVFTGLDAGALGRLAQTFRTSWYHVWTSTDFVGVEACAALKNCYALGVGFAEGILERSGEAESGDRNHDYEAALFGQAAVEIGQMVRLLGGEPETTYGLAGVGDMYVTSTGGRNVRVGRLVGGGLRFSEAREKMAGVTLEGAAAIEVVGGALRELTERGSIEPTDFPLMRHLYEVVVEDRPVQMPWETFFGGEG
jgi:glycerol-3-phosphate dehydrogenase